MIVCVSAIVLDILSPSVCKMLFGWCYRLICAASILIRASVAQMANFLRYKFLSQAMRLCVSAIMICTICNAYVTKLYGWRR